MHIHIDIKKLKNIYCKACYQMCVPYNDMYVHFKNKKPFMSCLYKSAHAGETLPLSKEECTPTSR